MSDDLPPADHPPAAHPPAAHPPGARLAVDLATGPRPGEPAHEPAWYALNPVLLKDLLTFARAPGAGGGLRTIGLTVVLGGPLLLLAWAMAAFPGPWRFAGAPAFLVMAAVMALFNFAVAVPAATAFALERDRETLESLIVSPLRPWQLVLGKLGAALTMGLLTRVALLPALGVAFALGGADLGFVPRWLVLLLCSDASFASLALLIGSRRRDPSARVGWFRAQTSQAQMALQSSVGLSVLASLVPLYAAMFLLPLSFQQGVRVPEVLDAIAPLGALHPLAALILWGDVDLLGLRTPVWVVASVFHVSLALPLLADAAEAQKSEGSAPGRAPRLLALPAVGLGLVLVWALATGLPQAGRVGVGLVFPALLLLMTALRAGYAAPRGPAQVTRPRILAGLLPHLALESLPERAPGYTLLVGLLCAPVVVGVGGGGLPAWGAWAALVLSGVALASLGGALVARARRAEDRAFLAALAAQAPVVETPEEEEAEVRSPRGRALLLLGLLAGLLPLFCGAGLLLGQGSLPQLLPLTPLLRLGLLLGLALNPLAGLVPVLADPALCGTDLPQRACAGLGLDPAVLLFVHVGAQLSLLLAALLTLRPPLDVEAALAARVGAGNTAPPSQGD